MKVRVEPKRVSQTVLLFSMRHLLLSFLGLFVVAALCALPAHGEPDARLSPEILARVRAACFEVVTEKPAKDSLTYETPLNRDLEDYSVRTDKYYPRGTAFAISPTEAVTAAHVFDLMPASLVYRTLFIRDRSRGGVAAQVWEVENIVALGEHRDYVVFTVKGKRFDTWLIVDTGFVLNSTIFTAGDAYGEGIVIRDGTLLDETPEEEEGAWTYLKSSAAVNPGNSGGPLLTPNGDAIGIVLSHRADICYSLPMREIVPRKAVLHRRMACSFDPPRSRRGRPSTTPGIFPWGTASLRTSTVPTITGNTAR